MNSVRQIGFAKMVSAVRFSISLKKSCAVAAIVSVEPKKTIAPRPKSEMNLSSDDPKLNSRKNCALATSATASKRRKLNSFCRTASVKVLPATMSSREREKGTPPVVAPITFGLPSRVGRPC